MRTSDIRQSVDVSNPLESEMTGTPAGISGPTFSSVARENWTGTAWKMKSQPSKASVGSSVALTVSGSSSPFW